jgi:uncharacterized protein (TIGR02466 family)
MNYENITLFATSTFYCHDIDLNHDKILNEIKELKYKPIYKHTVLHKGKIHTGTYITSNKTSIFNHMPSGELIHNELSKHIRFAINEYYQYITDFKITTNWVTRCEPKGVGEYHHHSNFWLTGCYYPHGTIEDKFYISFRRSLNNIYEPKRKNWNNLNSTTVEVFIKKGTLLIFPADLQHQIGYNNTNQDRYSIAFNILPVGMLGEADGEYEFK